MAGQIAYITKNKIGMWNSLWDAHSWNKKIFIYFERFSFTQMVNGAVWATVFSDLLNAIAELALYDVRFADEFSFYGAL